MATDQKVKKAGRPKITTFESFEKAIGAAGAIKKPMVEQEVTSTGILSLDIALEGGLPTNKTIMLYGAEATGKTTLAKLIGSEYVRRAKRLMEEKSTRAKKILWLDMENSFDVSYARLLGFDIDAVDEKGNPLLMVVRADTGENAWEIILLALESKQFALIVIDTLAKFAARVEMESDMNKAHMAVDARLHAHGFRVLTPRLAASEATLLVLNQERVDIANSTPNGYVPKTHPGGMSGKHEPWISMETMRIIREEKDGIIQRLLIRWHFKKSKGFAFSPKTVYQLAIACEPDRYYPDTGYELYVAANKLGIFKDAKGEPWATRVAYFNNERVGDGENNIIAFLGQQSDLQQQILAAIMEKVSNGFKVTASPVSEDIPGGADDEPEDSSDSPDAD